MKKTMIITGASSGIGKATAQLFDAQGWNVIATMRSPEREKELLQSDNLLVTKLDVQDSDSIKNTIATGIKQFGKIDLVVNSAGYGQYGVFEALTPEQIQKQFDVNVFGVMNVIRAVLPQLRAQKDGMIINISSGAGRFTLPSSALYSTSKFALEGFTEGISYELLAQNIKVKIVEPGGVATNFHTTSANEFAHDTTLTDYNEFLDAARTMFASWRNATLTTAEQVAAVIYEAATDGTDTLRYVIGDDIKPIIHAKTSMPDQDFINFMREKYMPEI